MSESTALLQAEEVRLLKGQIEKLETELRFWQAATKDLSKFVLEGPKAVSFSRMFEIGQAVRDMKSHDSE